MKPIDLNFIHGLKGGEVKTMMVFSSLFLIFLAYKLFSKAIHNFRYRKLFPIFGMKKKNGSQKLTLKRINRFTYIMTDCLDTLTLAEIKTPENKALLEKHIHGLKISSIEEEKRGFLFWKQSAFIIRAEQKLNNYTYDPSKLSLRVGDSFWGWNLAKGENEIENADTGAFSASIRGSSGSGKSNYANIAIDSWAQGCAQNHEPCLIIINDPKSTTYRWLKDKYMGSVAFYNATTLKGATEFREVVQNIYNNTIRLGEILKDHEVHVEHIKDLTPDQCKRMGITKPLRVLIVCEEYERYWNSSRSVTKPVKDSPEELKERYDLYQQQQIAGTAIDNLLGIGRAYAVSLIFITQSALVGDVDFPSEGNVQIVASSKITPEASSRIYYDREIATSSNCKTGEFIIKSDKGGIRKVQIPLFRRS